MPHEKETHFFRLLHLVCAHILSRWISHLTYVVYDEPKARAVLSARRDDPLFRQKYHILSVYGHFIFFMTGCKKLYPIERAIIDWSVVKIAEYSRNALHDYSMSLAVESVVSQVLISACMVVPEFHQRSGHKQINKDITYFHPSVRPYAPEDVQLFSRREREIMERVLQLVHSTELFEASTNEGARFPFTVAFLPGTYRSGDYSLEDISTNEFIKSLASARNFFFISENGKFVDYQDVGEARIPLDDRPVFFKRKGHWHFLNFCALMDAINLYLGDLDPTYDPEAIGLTILDMLLKQTGC